MDGSVAVFACNPGECHTNIVRDVPAWVKFLQKLLVKPLLLTSERGEAAMHSSMRIILAEPFSHIQAEAA